MNNFNSNFKQQQQQQQESQQQQQSKECEGFFSNYDSIFVL